MFARPKKVMCAHARAGGGWNRALGEGCENSHLLRLRHFYEVARLAQFSLYVIREDIIKLIKWEKLGE